MGSSARRLYIGIDIGGTFTDFVHYQADTGQVESFKLLSTPSNPADAVLAGLAKIRESYGQNRPISLIHGSTVATNALLERKGAQTAFVTTRGFRDILQIARQNRPALYDLFADPPPPLIPKDLRFEVDERVDHQGEVIVPLEPSQIDPLIRSLRSSGIASVAICLLFSFLYPGHEQMIAGKLRQAGFFVSLSSEILPEYREYERASTTAVNAYVSPVLDRYLSQLETAASGLEAAISIQESAERDRLNNPVHLRVMQSNGGAISLDEARRSGVRCILSGPAGGIVGAQQVGRLVIAVAGLKLITFDMGGTSTDVSLIDGSPRVTVESIVGGCPIHIPILDIHTIGAGGGSIAAVDPGGALRVGPHSAGADPGPACYGRGELSHARPTVTDANLVLGRLAPERFLGGQMQLDADRARFVIESLGKRIGLDAFETASGVIEVVNAHMESALRVISVEKGYDPQDFTLLSFGGAGGLHAVDLARRLRLPRVLVPPLASTLSAFGMLAADVVKDYTQTVMLTCPPPPGEAPLERLQSFFAPMVARAVREVREEGIPDADILIEKLLDMRCQGQSYELTLPLPADGDRLRGDFHALHQRTYGYARPEAATEIVNIRVRAAGRVPHPEISPAPPTGPDPAPAYLDHRRVMLADGTWASVPFYRGEALRPENRLDGPAVVLRSDTTILLGPGDRARVDAYRNLMIEVT